jgi:hypothetical protein
MLLAIMPIMGVIRDNYIVANLERGYGATNLGDIADGFMAQAPGDIWGA